ncbi:DUF1837 domain-containing protein [Methylobacterium sp. BTF04]|uniref:HamA C-terminal domain-containing protein n=1 Tax=Methylobacterium sp. BTF04 TaxID=2708300 RepID=UPI0013D46CE6|nr:DUF1837 domain-containing protein [Methylobacterium sp. BTF04]NEU11568.1 DUF1837 domain-containing protein [Methylobacterium sp. BTF04]
MASPKVPYCFLVAAGVGMSIYDTKPDRMLTVLSSDSTLNPMTGVYCAGFELEEWRCVPLSRHLVEWLPEYALVEEELQIHHGNIYVKLSQAAARVYTSEKYELRGEAGEIALHAICRDYFNTIPISPRVFYKSATNDVIKAFDMVHARFPTSDTFEVWLGESKLYATPSRAIDDALKSINMHLERGFLEKQKLLLGPQIPKSTPNYEKISAIFKMQSSIDEFVDTAVFVVGIATNSKAVGGAKKQTAEYIASITNELAALSKKINVSKLALKIRLVLLYIPLGSKSKLVFEFDKRLKGLQ